MSANHIKNWLMAVLCLFLISSPAYAGSAAATGGVMIDLVNQFHTAAASWTTRALQIGNWIFYTLAVLELTWAASLWAMEKDSASSLIVALVRKFMVLGFFYTFLIMAPTWIPAIINSLQGAGAKIGGTTVGAITPMSIVGHGINIVNAIWKAFSASALSSLSAMAMAIVLGGLVIVVTIAIILSFVYIAIEYVMTMIESYIVLGMGLVLMGFSGSQWTRDFSQKYIGYAFSVGVKLMVLTLIISLIISISSTWPNDVRAALTGTDMFAWIQPMFMISASSILLALLAIKIPSLASSLLSGAPSLGAAAAVGAAAGAAAGVAGLAVGASKLLGAGASAAGAVGGAATKGIAAAAVGGTGMAQAAGAASNLATASGFTPGSAAHTGATAGNMVAGLGGMAATGMSNMAGSAKSAISGTAKGMVENFKGAVSNSTGGKLAASLDEKAVGKLSSGGGQAGAESSGAGGGSSSASDSSASTVSPPTGGASGFSSSPSGSDSPASVATVPPPAPPSESPSVAAAKDTNPSAASASKSAGASAITPAFPPTWFNKPAGASAIVSASESPIQTGSVPPASAATVPPPSPSSASPNATNPSAASAKAPVSPPNSPTGKKPMSVTDSLKKGIQQLPLDHGAVAAAAPKLYHHEP